MPGGKPPMKPGGTPPGAIVVEEIVNRVTESSTLFDLRETDDKIFKYGGAEEEKRDISEKRSKSILRKEW